MNMSWSHSFEDEIVEHFKKLFEKYQKLDKDKKMAIIPALYGTMISLYRNGTTSDKIAAEKFFEVFEHLLEEVK